jgi:hypothetical protein
VEKFSRGRRRSQHLIDYNAMAQHGNTLGTPGTPGSNVTPNGLNGSDGPNGPNSPMGSKGETEALMIKQGTSKNVLGALFKVRRGAHLH